MPNPKNRPIAPSKSFFSVVVPVVVMMFVTADAARQETQPDKQAPTSLEVRITAPPRWENGCLFVALDRTNRSSSTLFLTTTGPYFYIALDVSNGEANKGEGIEWVNIYGIVDIVVRGASRLGPGATVHNEFCLGSSVWVVNLKKETRREIPVRGRLRVDVSYFRTEESWTGNKEWYDTSTPPRLDPDGTPREPPRSIAPEWARAFAAIPCSAADCKSECAGPPVGLPGEFRAAPDAYYIYPRWNERGRLLAEELARKFPPCTEDKSVPR
jgi:hypothetical protein